MNKSNIANDPPPFAERLWPGFCWLVFSYFVTVIVLNRGVYTLISLLMIGVVFVAVYGYRPRWDFELRALALLLIVNLFLSLPNIFLGNDGLLSLSNPVRMLFMLPFVFAVMRFGMKLRFICIGLATGMLIAALIVSWQFFLQDVGRPAGYSDPIPFGEVAMSAFAMLLAACLVIQDRWVPLYLAGLVAALYCVILTNSRGPLLAILPILLFLLWWGWQRGTLNHLFSGRRVVLILMILLFLGSVVIGKGHLIDRIKIAVTHTNDYFQKDDASTSVGLRLELWRGAWLAGNEHPILGVGEFRRQPFIAQKIIDGELKSDIAANWIHVHNDYLNALQFRGYPGLLLVLVFYALMMLIFLRSLSLATGEQLVASLGGALITVGYATYSLTSVPMRSGITVIFYVITISICIGIIKHSPRTNSAENPS